MAAIKSLSPGAEDKILLEFGRNAIINSLVTLKEFVSFMVPLTTGLITTYVAILQFMGIQNILDVSNAIQTNFILPPMFMLLSLVAFIFATFPVARWIAAGNLKSIRKFRSDTFWWKYIGCVIGSAFFVTGIVLMLVTLVPPLSDPENDNNGLLTFKNERYNYELEYPNYWSISIMNNSRDVKLLVPGDQQPPTVFLSVREFSKTPKLHEYARTQMHLLQGNTSTPTTLGGLPSYTIQWSNNTTSGIEIVSIVNNKGILVDYYSNKLDYSIYRNISQKIIESIKLKL